MLFQRATLLSLVTAVATQGFNVSVWDRQDGDLEVMRMWYGDGIAYVGPTVPDTVDVAFHVTCPTFDPPGSLILFPTTASDLPSFTNTTGNTTLTSDTPLFLAINTAAEAEDPFTFLTALEDLADGWTATWGVYEGVLFPMDGEGTGSLRSGMAFVGPAGEEDEVEDGFEDGEDEEALVVRWNVEGLETERSLRVVSVVSRDRD